MKRTSIIAILAAFATLTLIFGLYSLRQRDSLSKDEFLRGLSLRAIADETDLVVEVSCDVRRPELWHVYRLYAHVGEEKRLLGRSVSRLGLASVVRRVPLDDLRGIDLSNSKVQLEYAVYRGQRDDGSLDPGPPDDDQLSPENLLFSGTVGIETDLRKRSPDE